MDPAKSYHHTNLDSYAKEIKLPSAKPNPSLKSAEEVKVQTATTEIFNSNMHDVREGQIDPSVAQAHIEELKHTREESGITFNENSIEKALSGGACSAVSLTFIDHFLKGMKELQKPGEDITAEDVIHVIQSLSTEEPAGSESVHPGNQFQNLEKSIRSLQAALNTIEVSDQSLIDAKSRKIQSIVESKALTVTDRTSSFHVDGAKLSGNFKHEIENLPPGVYLLRGIFPSKDPQSKKKEGYGHTTVFIQHRDCAFFFDPNKGACFIPKDLKSSEMENKIIGQFQDHSLSQFRFYKIDEKGDLPIDKKKLLLRMNYQAEIPDEQAHFFLDKKIKKLTKVATISEVMDLALEEKKALTNPSTRSTKFAIDHAKELNLKLGDLLKITHLPQEEAIKFIVDLPPAPNAEVSSKPMAAHKFLQLCKEIVENTAVPEFQIALCNKMLGAMVGSELLELVELHSINDLTLLIKILERASENDFSLTSALKIFKFSLNENFVYEEHIPLLMPLLNQGIIGIDDLANMEPRNITDAMGSNIQPFMVSRAKILNITLADLYLCSQGNEQKLIETLLNRQPIESETNDNNDTNDRFDDVLSNFNHIGSLTNNRGLQIALCIALHRKDLKSINMDSFERLVATCLKFRRHRIYSLSLAIKISELTDIQIATLLNNNSFKKSYKDYSQLLKKEGVVTSDDLYNLILKENTP